MRRLVCPPLVLGAGPALAHHEVVVATSMVSFLPLIAALVAAPLAGFAAWRKARRGKD